MIIRRFSLAAIVFCVAGLVLPSAAWAQAGTTGGTGGGGSTTTTTSAEHKGEIDMPIGAPQPDPMPAEDEDGPPKLYDEEIPTKSDSIIYVIDVSGSMDWDSRSYTGLDGATHYGTRLERAKCELTKSIQALSSEFEFNAFSYDCSVYQMWGAKRKADPSAKASAIQWVSHLQALGATGTGPAVVRGLSDKTNLSVVLLSDGDPNCGASPENASGHLRMIQAANTQGAAITCFGISCYGSFEQFMRAIAQSSGGRYIPVP